MNSPESINIGVSHQIGIPQSLEVVDPGRSDLVRRNRWLCRRFAHLVVPEAVTEPEQGAPSRG